MNRKTETATFAVAAILATSATFIASGVSASASRDVPPACQLLPDTPSAPPSGPPEMKPTTITTIGQAYYCILDNYYRGPFLDDRSLLVPAFAALTQELQRRGLDQAVATLPALTGKNDREHRDRNWAAFSQVYEQISARLPTDPAVRQAVAEATLRAMVRALEESHANWDTTGGGRSRSATGMTLSVSYGGPGGLDPAAQEPLVVTQVEPASAAERAGVKPGDEIMAINGVPPYVNGVVSPGAVAWITDPSEGTPIALVLHRPVTDAIVTVTVTPSGNGGPGPGPGPGPGGGETTLPGPGAGEPKLVDGNIAYVSLAAFTVEVADKALRDIAELRTRTPLRGVILDLRGNGGGDPNAVAKMLGALTHDTVTDYFCDGKDHCAANYSDSSVALFNLRFVALVDRKCASACEQFASAVKDLGLGALVGSRTAGRANPAHSYSLDDRTILWLPAFYQLGASGEIYATIGVAADYYALMAAADLSAGRDPALATAIQLFR
jgi:carboxyl-terminal processing protease